MKKFFLLTTLVLSLSLSADSLIAEEEEYPPTKIEKVLIQPYEVREVTTYYPNASEDEDSVVVSFVTVFKGKPSKVKEVDLDSDVGIFY